MRVEKYQEPREIMGISNIVAMCYQENGDCWSYVQKINDGYTVARVDDSGDTPEFEYQDYELALEKAKWLIEV
jgi:hypothetical protein